MWSNDKMKTVVVVDDSAVMRKLVSTMLSNIGFNVIGEANSGESGVQLYTELRPDIITLDVIMGKISGLDALKQIMEIDKSAQVIMISSMAQKPIVQEAVSCGAKGFIIKPFDEFDVKRAMSKVLNS